MSGSHRVALVPLLVSAAVAQQATAQDVRELSLAAGVGSLAPELNVADDHVVLSWLEPAKATQPTRGRRYALRFATLEGGAWTRPRTVTAGTDLFVNWADFPSVVPAGDGTLLAHWLERSGDGGHAYGIRLARSTDGGAEWTMLGALHDDDTPTEHGFVSIVPDAKGFEAVWLDGRAMVEDGGQMSLRSAHVTDRVANATVVDADVCTCCQTDLVRVGDELVAVYRDHTEGEIRDISIARRTKDKWSKPRPVHTDGWNIAGCPVNGPSVAANSVDLAVAWFTAAQGEPRVLVAVSEDAGRSFVDPIVVDVDDPVGRASITAWEDVFVVCWLAKVDGPVGADAAVRLQRVGIDGVVGEAITVAHTGTSRSSGFPRLVRHDRELVVAWRDVGSEPARVRTVLVERGAFD